MLSNKELRKLQDEYEKLKIKCKCGHSIVIPIWMDKKLCNWCNNYVYRNKKLEFKEKIMKYR